MGEAPIAGPSAPPAAPAPGERDTHTFLVVDLEGSTGLVERLGDAYASLLHRYHELVQEVTARRGGQVVSTEGDGLLGAADGITDPASRLAREAGRQMNPLEAAELALAPRPVPVS